MQTSTVRLQFTHLPGTSRSAFAKDQVGDGSVRLMPPSEDRFCCSTKVCVWTLKSIKQKSHRAAGSSLQAFGQIFQILKRGRIRCSKCMSVTLAFCEAHLLAHRPCHCPRTTSRILAAMTTFHTREIWTTKSTLGSFCLCTLKIQMRFSLIIVKHPRGRWCFPIHKPGPKGRHLVPLPVSSEEWDEDEQPLFWSKGYSLTANMRDRFLKVHSLKRHNGEEFILLQVEKCFTIQTNSKDNTLLWIQWTYHSRLTTDLMEGVGEVILPSYVPFSSSVASICTATSSELAEKTSG